MTVHHITEASQADDSVAVELDADWREERERFKALAKAAGDQRWEIGDEWARVSDKAYAEAKAMGNLTGAEIAVHVSYRLDPLAAEFDGIYTRNGLRGMVTTARAIRPELRGLLSHSHYFALSSVHPDHIEPLVREAAESGWTVETLKAEINRRFTPAVGRGPAKAGDDPNSKKRVPKPKAIEPPTVNPVDNAPDDEPYDVTSNVTDTTETDDKETDYRKTRKYARQTWVNVGKSFGAMLDANLRTDSLTDQERKILVGILRTAISRLEGN